MQASCHSARGFRPPQQPRREHAHDYRNPSSLTANLPFTPPPTYAMYEPHLVDFANQHSHDNEGMSLLEELDKIAPIKRFDAFPKVRLLFLVPAR